MGLRSGWFPDMDHLSVFPFLRCTVPCMHGQSFPDLWPTVMDALHSQLETNRMEDMVGKHRNEQVAIRASLNMMAYRSIPSQISCNGRHPPHPVWRCKNPIAPAHWLPVCLSGGSKRHLYFPGLLSISRKERLPNLYYSSEQQSQNGGPSGYIAPSAGLYINQCL